MQQKFYSDENERSDAASVGGLWDFIGPYSAFQQISELWH